MLSYSKSVKYIDIHSKVVTNYKHNWLIVDIIFDQFFFSSELAELTTSMLRTVVI